MHGQTTLTLVTIFGRMRISRGVKFKSYDIMIVVQQVLDTGYRTHAPGIRNFLSSI
jgi:hypothetical protein